MATTFVPQLWSPTVHPLAPSPYFGGTNADQETAALLPALQNTPLSFPTTYAGTAAGQPASDQSAAEWTPETAAEQSDRALARIGQANPELAQKLAEMHGKAEAGQGEDLPWYKDVLNGIATVTHATGLDVVFDYLNRPLQAVAEVVHDWGKESVWKNIGDGLTGNSDIFFSDVLRDNFGMKDGLLTSVLGFALDVALDPVTWVSLGTGALGRAIVGKTVAGAGVTTLLDDPIRASLRGTLLSKFDNVEDAARFIVQQGEGGAGVSGFLERMRGALKGVHPDARVGAYFALEKAGQQEAMRELVKHADLLFKQATTVGWQRTTAAAASKLGVEKSAVDDILRQFVKKGTGFGIARPLYKQGRAAGAALGGARFRFSIPVLGIRAAGLKIPLWPARMDFSIGRRFMAGLSGHVRLSRMIGEGTAGATLRDMEILWREGRTGLLKRSPAVAAAMGKNGRSALYATSELVGKGTKLLTPNAAVLRGGGLAASYAGDVKKLTRHIVNSTKDDLLTIEKDGVALSARQTREEFARIIASVPAEKQLDLYNSVYTLRNLVPDPDALAGAYYDNLISDVILTARKAGTEESTEVLERVAELRALKVRAQGAEDAVKSLAGTTDIARIWGKVADRTETLRREIGGTPAFYDEVNDISINDLHPEDVLSKSNGREWYSDAVTASSDVGMKQAKSVGSSEVPLFGLHADDVPPVRPGAAAGEATPTPKGPAEAAVPFVIPKATKEQLEELLPKHPIQPGESSQSYFERLDRIAAGLPEKADPGDVLHLGAPAPTPKGGPVVLDEATRKAAEAARDEASKLSLDDLPNTIIGGKEDTDALRVLEVLLRNAVESGEVTGTAAAQLGALNLLDEIRGKLSAGTLKWSEIRQLSDVGFVTEDQLLAFINRSDVGARLAKKTDAALSDVQTASRLTEAEEAAAQLDNPYARAALEENNAARGLLGDARQDPELLNRRILRDGERIGELGNDRGYYYHATNSDDASSLVGREQILPHQSTYGMDPSFIPPEQRIGRAFVADTADDALDLTRGKGGDRSIFRIPRSDVDPLRLRPDTAPGTEGRSWYATQPIPMQTAEMLDTAGNWVPAPTKVGAVAEPQGPAAKLMATLTADVQAAVAEGSRMGRLTDAEMDYLQRPSIVQMGGDRNLIIDRTPRVRGKATEADLIIDPIAEFQDKVRPFLEDLESGGPKSGLEELGDDVADIVREVLGAEGGMEEQLGRMTTEWLRRQGYTGVEIRHAGGRELVIFADASKVGIPAARVNPFAARTGAIGSPLRSVTDSAREAVLGAKPRKGNTILSRVLRETAKLPPAQAESKARAILSKAGIEIDGTFFETDALRVLAGSVDDAARETGQVYVGKAMRHAENLGMTRGNFGGGPVGLERYSVVLNEEGARWAAKTADDIKAIQTRVGHITNRAIPEMQAQAEAANREITELSAVLDDLATNDAVGAQALLHRGEALTPGQLKKKLGVLQRESAKASEQLDRFSLGIAEGEAEIESLMSRTTMDRAPAMAALIPAENAANMAGMVQVRVPGFEGMAMPVFMAEEFEAAMRGFPKIDGAHLAYRQFNNWWKTFATWLNPGFHMRNIQGAWFNSWLGGVGMPDYITTSRIRRAEREIVGGVTDGKWRRALVIDNDPSLIAGMKFGEPSGYMGGKRIEDLTYGDLAQMTGDLNLTASNGRAFAEAVVPAEREAIAAEASAAKLAKRNYVGRVAKPYVKLMRGTGTLTENTFRTATWLKGLRDGSSTMEARAFTMMRHGDYEDLTDFEYSVVRDLIPFYKWMRTNTPFQIHQLLENPAKLLAVGKAQRAVYEAQGLDFDEEAHRMPKWMSEGFTIPYGKGEGPGGLTTYETVMLDLPMSDLFMGGREFVSSWLPLVRPFLESYVYKQQTFSGRPITGAMKPMNDIFTPLAPLFEAVGMATRGEDGGLYMSDQTENLIGIMPLYSRFKSYIYSDEASVSRRSNQMASAVFGVQLRPVDESALTANELSFYYDQILPTVEYLRDLGYPLPTTADLEHTVGTTNQILTSLGITPGAVCAVAA